MLSFNELSPSLQSFLTDPRASVFVSDFLTSRHKTVSNLTQTVQGFIEACIYGSISIEDMLSEVQTIATLSDDEIGIFFQAFLEILDEEGLAELEKYPLNKEEMPLEKLFEPSKKQVSVAESVKEISRNPDIVHSKLLQVLESFNLHVDEKGIIAHEVERYLKGEVLSSDLVPHLTAMLDKPLSEIHTIVNALNSEIFKPIQKQIAEEGTLDISYDNDPSLQNFLIQKKGTGTPSGNSANSSAKKIDFKNISFLPKKVVREVSQQEKDAVFSNLRTQGGTPNGTSLFSQEIRKNSITEPSIDVNNIDVIQKAKKEKYTIDPYREIL